MASKAETAESFQAEMRHTFLSGFKLAGLALGMKLDLFKEFGDNSEALTSGDLAAKANYKERYVREWLHHMVMCDVIDVDETGKLFTLPKYRKDALLDKSSLLYIMGPAFSGLFNPHYDLLRCFQLDGPEGLPFESVLPFFDERTLKNTPGLQLCADYVRDNVPGLRQKLEAGINVCEIGVGNGQLSLHLASQFSKSTFTGLDLSKDLLDKARTSLAEKKLSNVKLFLRDATEMPQEWNNTFDLVVIRDVLHDIAEASKCLRSVYQILKPGGELALFEVNVSQNPHKSLQNLNQKTVGQVAYIISCYHCLPASLYYPGSEGLGAGSGVEVFKKKIEDAGFVFQNEHRPADFFNVLFIAKKLSK